MDSHIKTLLIGILMVSIKSFINPCRGNESSARSIDLSSAWRPIHFTQHQQQQQQPQAPQSHLISISSLDNANKLQLYQIAQYNAQILQKLKDMEEALRRSHINVDKNAKTSNGPTGSGGNVNTNSISHAFENPHVRLSNVGPTLGAPVASPTTLKQSPQFLPYQNHIKPPFPIHVSSSNVVYNSIPHSQNFLPNNGYSVKQPSAYVTGKPMYYGKYDFKTPYYSSTPKMPVLIKQSQHISNYPNYYRSPAMYRDPSTLTTPTHPVMGKLQAHMAMKQRYPVPVQHIKIGNASIPAHIISSLSIFGNALQQIRDTKQKETILNHLLRNITTTASTYIPASIISTINSFQSNPTIESPTGPSSHDSVMKQSNIKPIPVTMSPTIRGPTVISYREPEVQSTISIPKHQPVFSNNFQDPITPQPTLSSYDFSFGSSKHGHHQKPHFLPTVPSQDNPVRVKSISPLQDASRFAYKTTHTASTSYPDKLYTVTAGKPPAHYKFNGKEYIQSTTENVFHNFDFPQLSSSYNRINYKPSKKQNLKVVTEVAQTTVRIPEFSPSHSFFTMDDAVTSVPDYYLKNQVKENKHRVKEGQTQRPDREYPFVNEFRPLQSTQVAPSVNTDYSFENSLRVVSTTKTPIPVTSSSTTTTVHPSTMYFDSYPTEAPTVRPRIKHRRKKPRPQFVSRDHELDTATSNTINNWEQTRNRHRVRGRPSVDVIDPQTESIFTETPTESPYKSTERVKFPSRTRLTTEFVNPEVTPEEDQNDITTKQRNPVYKHTSTEKEEEIIPTTSTTTTTHFNEDTTTDEHVKHRLRYRYKSRTRPTTTATTTTSTEGKVLEDLEDITINPMDEIKDKMVLKLLNSVANGSPQSTEDTFKEDALITTTLTPTTARFRPIAKYDSKNRPRFSVKDYRNRLNSSTTSSTKTTDASTTPSNLFRNRNKYNKEEVENKLTKRISTTTSKPRSTLPAQPRRKTLPARLDNINRFRMSSSTGPSTTAESSTSISQTTPMSIKLKNSYQIRTRSKPAKAENLDKFNSNENDISEMEEDELVRSESNHYNDNDNEEVEDKSQAPELESVTEKSHETSIMKIAKDDHSYRSHVYRSSTTPSTLSDIMNSLETDSNNILQRVSDLTVTSGQNSFNSVNTQYVSRKIPNYFTIATEDPILPIEAFFPNVINKD